MTPPDAAPCKADPPQANEPKEGLLAYTRMTEDMKRRWDFVERRELLYSLVGYDFGMEPEARLDDIRAYKRRECQFLLDTLTPGAEDVVLDLGSGCGFIARVFAPRCRQVLCLDISAEFLKFAREELREFPNVELSRIEPGDLRCLEGRSVNKGYANAVFIHLNFFDIVIYLRELHRVLTPGGLFVFGMANTDCLDLQRDRYFEGVLERYRQDRTSPTLMQWNSANGVCAVARQLGFQAKQLWTGAGTAMVLLQKAEPGARGPLSVKWPPPA
jgi:SAM-dependent methyltransferase